MADFEKTLMGKKYYQKDVPALIESNNRLAKALEKYTKIEEKKIVLEAKKQRNENKINESGN